MNKIISSRLNKIAYEFLFLFFSPVYFSLELTWECN